MEASELRLGNYILLRSEDFRDSVTGNPLSGAVILLLPVSKDFDWQLHSDKFTSIPLTDAVLEACGFEKREECFRIMISDKYGDIYLVRLKDNEFGIGEYNRYRNRLEFLTYTIPCAALHQLQNLYHAITGKELEIDETKLKQAIANEDK